MPEFAVSAFVFFLVIVDPPGLAPLFMSISVCAHQALAVQLVADGVIAMWRG